MLSSLQGHPLLAGRGVPGVCPDTTPPGCCTHWWCLWKVRSEKASSVRTGGLSVNGDLRDLGLTSFTAGTDSRLALLLQAQESRFCVCLVFSLNSKFISSQLECRNPGSRCWQRGSLQRPLSLACRWPLLTLPPVVFEEKEPFQHSLCECGTAGWGYGDRCRGSD